MLWCAVLYCLLSAEAVRQAALQGLLMPAPPAGAPASLAGTAATAAPAPAADAAPAGVDPTAGDATSLAGTAADAANAEHLLLHDDPSRAALPGYACGPHHTQCDGRPAAVQHAAAPAGQPGPQVQAVAAAQLMGSGQQGCGSGMQPGVQRPAVAVAPPATQDDAAVMGSTEDSSAHVR